MKITFDTLLSHMYVAVMVELHCTCVYISGYIAKHYRTVDSIMSKILFVCLDVLYFSSVIYLYSHVVRIS
jgi:hypothetical protein